MKVISIVGARPQFIKLAPLSRNLASKGVNHKIIHSGQHYDANMSDIFFSDLDIQEPEFKLSVGGRTTAIQIAETIKQCEPILLSEKPNMVIVYGDTNTTLGGAIVAKSLKTNLAHVEAGLRSYNKEMQEELNRICVDHLSDLRFCPTPASLENLTREGLRENSIISGDIMKDSFEYAKEKCKAKNFQRDYTDTIFCTIHRAENTDNPERLNEIIHALSSLNQKIVIPVHPRLRKNLLLNNEVLQSSRIILIEPLSYLETIHALNSCASVITDSGGLQKDAWFANKPCIT